MGKDDKKCGEDKTYRNILEPCERFVKTNMQLQKLNFNSIQLGWESAVNCGLADSCLYLKPDVLTLGLSRDQGIVKQMEECDDGVKEIKSNMKLKP